VLADFTSSLRDFALNNLSQLNVSEELLEPIKNAKLLFLPHIENLRSELSTFL